MSIVDLHDIKPGTEPAFTPRQQEVLECALRLLVEGGEKALTTAGLARSANCSKESLYKWFGDRDGLLAAVVAYQASKVHFASEAAATDAATFRTHLTGFVRELLQVLLGETSLALNRLAIGQSKRDDDRLGRLLLVRGKYTISARARSLLEAGRFRGFLRFDDAEEAYQVLYGLAVRDLHIRQLLGDPPKPRDQDFAGQAELAVDRFYRLFGA
ncbi:TetR/AcrR family transcriptional regulator [Polymorphum gilvum]|uniref:Probable transcriptional regulator protein, TetR family n=1 Tax=Polymorphum gilvum (strain LMG 25793 / CGMCC 1.9160 / SL003B-26A1) TaxID=991905 RepID=F2J2D0_POLGS|nr:TetR/AcrR family transcriptional regulator C-terminal domain-containing protein [Polymorphum gilvum]ADZ69826.1 probable transcriptional regulator protein, TetR family [Polymorphum gilvum SL003B-26A1]